MSDEALQSREGSVACPIETSEDSPVCLSPTVGSTLEDRALTKSRIVSIDGVDVSDPRRVPLPGIRVGDGEGTGYVLSRAMDDQFVFVPDAGYIGETHLVVGIEEGDGRVVERMASILVRPGVESPGVVAFANGSQSATVVEGVEAAIVGALTIDGARPKAHDEVRIVERGSGNSPEKFSVVSDKLLLNAAIMRTTDEVVRLKVVVVEDDFEVAGNELEITVQSAVQSANAVDGGFAGPGSRLRLMASDPTTSDQFNFRAFSEPSAAKQDADLNAADHDETNERSEDSRADEVVSAGELGSAVPDTAFDPFAE